MCSISLRFPFSRVRVAFLLRLLPFVNVLWAVPTALQPPVSPLPVARGIRLIFISHDA
jgi:hypothetical protein